MVVRELADIVGVQVLGDISMLYSRSSAVIFLFTAPFNNVVCVYTVGPVLGSHLSKPASLPGPK